jgi:hypothetical protein
MRAASWLREARRAPEEDFEGSGPDCEALDGFALIARSMAWSSVLAVVAAKVAALAIGAVNRLWVTRAQWLRVGLGTHGNGTSTSIAPMSFYVSDRE